jgi:hypothetical protein
MAERRDQQGTGRHPHKDTQEPRPHTKDEGRHQQSGSLGKSGESSVGSPHATDVRERDRNEDADLKRREYKGEDGETHHHTRTYMEQHRGENRNESHSGGEKGGGSRRR